MKEKYPYVGGKMSTNFPGCSDSMDFTAFSHAIGNWLGNPCILHIIKYTIGCECNGKKALILWEKYECHFPRFSIYDGFCRIFPGTNFCLFPCSGKLMRKPMHFQYDEVYHRIGIYWKKSPILWKKYGNQFLRPFLFDGFRWLF